MTAGVQPCHKNQGRPTVRDSRLNMQAASYTLLIFTIPSSTALCFHKVVFALQTSSYSVLNDGDGIR